MSGLSVGHRLNQLERKQGLILRLIKGNSDDITINKKNIAELRKKNHYEASKVATQLKLNKIAESSTPVARTAASTISVRDRISSFAAGKTRRKRTHKRTYKRTHKGGSSKKGMKKIICRKMFFDKDDPCLPRNTLNNFYFKTPSPCYENHRGAHINLNAKGCAWYDIDTNKKVSSDFDKFKNKNLHGKTKKQYVWKKN